MVSPAGAADTQDVATPSHDEIRDLLAPYALGVLEDDESRLVSSHLADCAECRAELRGLQEAVLRLAADTEQLSPEVWERILRRIRRPTDE